MNERARVGSDTVSVHALGAELRVVLDRIKRAIDAEIAAYPTPIPRCDAQFNHLYDDRARLASLLGGLDAALARNDDEAVAAAIADFATAPAAREDTAASQLVARIRRVLAAGG